MPGMASKSQSGHLPHQYARQHKGVMTCISALMKAFDDEDKDFVVFVVVAESNEEEKEKAETKKISSRGTKHGGNKNHLAG